MLVLTKCLFIGSLIGSLAIPAAMAEPLYFWWDVGSPAREVDAGDLILNVAESCRATRKISVNIPPLIVTQELPQLLLPSGQQTQELLSAFGLNLSSKKYLDYIWSFDHFRGQSRETVFVLLPEVHYSPMPENEEAHTILQVLTSLASASIAEDALKDPHTNVLNLKEGIEGNDWRISDLKFAGQKLLEKVFAIGQHTLPTPFLTIGNVFEKDQRVQTQYLETPKIIVANILITFGEYEQKMNFDDLLTKLKAHPRFFSELTQEQIKSVFEYLESLPSEKFEYLRSSICAVRGYDMADTAIQLSHQQKATLTFLSYGASHHFEITQRLREAGLSYIALLGKRPSP